MRKRHRIIDKKRVGFFTLHKLIDVIHPLVRPILALGLDQRAVFEPSGIGVPRAFVFGVQRMIQGVLIKAGVFGVHPDATPSFRTGVVRWIVALQLPFACDSRFVTSLFQIMTKRFLARVHNPKANPVAIVVHPRHQLHASVRTERLSMSV